MAKEYNFIELPLNFLLLRTCHHKMNIDRATQTCLPLMKGVRARKSVFEVQNKRIFLQRNSANLFFPGACA